MAYISTYIQLDGLYIIVFGLYKVPRQLEKNTKKMPENKVSSIASI